MLRKLAVTIALMYFILTTVGCRAASRSRSTPSLGTPATPITRSLSTAIATTAIPSVPLPTTGAVAVVRTTPTRLVLMPSPLPQATPTVSATPTSGNTRLTPTPKATDTAQPTITPTAPGQSNASAASSGQIDFWIVREESRIRFELTLDEGDKQTTLAGETNKIYGQFTLDYDDPPASRFGSFGVILRELKEYPPGPEPGIWERWLETTPYRVASFAVTETRGLPAHLLTGKPISFQLVGVIEIRGTFVEAVWDVTAILDTDRVSGTATTSVALADLGLPPPDASDALLSTDSAALKLDFMFVELDPMPVPQCDCGG